LDIAYFGIALVDPLFIFLILRPSTLCLRFSLPSAEVWVVQGTQLGPYRLLSELGSGGMGTVHAAEVAEAVAGLETGQKVAVKVIHPHLLGSPGFFKRFLREAELGRRVVHENVVRTFDVDATELEGKAVHYMAMEYVEGRSLRKLLLDLGTIPEALLREIALQTAAGLAAIHEEGIVHRDLKPENILITDDHEIRIMDLGVAKLQEASIAITQEGQFAGSLLYAAPEQFGAGETGPSADLYSLGVLLYELATGDNPFRRDNAPAAIEAQLKLQPPRITDRNTETTTFFAELVATLLAKRPAERFASAQALHDVLAEAERSRWWTELAPRITEKVAHLPRIRVRRETAVHGRDGDLETLSEAWARAKERRGNTVFVEGEAGIGKTRLVDAFLRGLEDKDIHILYGSYPPSGGLGGISDAILDKFGEAMLSIALAPYLTVTPSLIPAFTALVKHESPPTGSEPLQGDALNAVCVHLMRGLAEEKPLVWIVEDLHFAPRESRDTVLALARAVEGHRVLLVATARPGVADEDQAHLSRLENYRRVPLHRLGAREMAELLEGAFKSEALAEKLGMRIAKKSDGVPFFIFEMIRGLKEKQLIEQQADGTYVQTQMIKDIEVPSAVKDLIEGRLRGLDPDQRRILDAGSVMGMSFDPGLVGAVLEAKKVRVLEHLAVVERQAGLVHGERGAVCFDQNQIQEVLYQDLMPDLRSEYHSLLAGAYAQRLDGQPTGEDAVFLASHHLRGSSARDGLPHLMAALQHLEQSYRNDVAIELAARALNIPKLVEGRDRVEVLLMRAGRHDLRGERDLERAALDEALGLADETGDAALGANVRIVLGWHLIQTSDYAAAHECLQTALDLAREASAKTLESVATGYLGNVCWGQGGYDEALVLFQRHLTLSREIGDRRGEGKATGSLGIVLGYQGRYEEAKEHFQSALASLRESGDRRGEAATAGNLGSVFHSQGRYEEARAQFQKHLRLAREIGDRQGEALATGNLGGVFFGQGHYEKARAHHARRVALSREIGDRAGEASATGKLGLVFLAQGRSEEARAHLEKQLALSREIGDRRSEAIATGYLADVVFGLGRSEEARARLNESLALSREIGLRQAEGHALASLASCTEAEGDTESALRLHGEALAIQRELDEKDSVGESLVAMAAIGLKRDDGAGAIAHLEEALALARKVDAPGTILLATVHRARLPDGDIAAGLAALEAHEERVAHDTKMEAGFRLWELTQDKAHLEEAHRLLCYARDHAPEDCRDSMIQNVPLHRDIMQAWEERGGP
jgi:serine/threonine protein kinase/tetratricopeptide (TPR) repeat protein